MSSTSITLLLSAQQEPTVRVCNLMEEDSPKQSQILVLEVGFKVTQKDGFGSTKKIYVIVQFKSVQNFGYK